MLFMPLVKRRKLCLGIDLDQDENPRAVRALGIRAFPRVLGASAWRFVGRGAFFYLLGSYFILHGLLFKAGFVI